MPRTRWFATLGDGGEGGIRTLEAGISRLRDFQSRSFGQLGHLSVRKILTKSRSLPAGRKPDPAGYAGHPSQRKVLIFPSRTLREEGWRRGRDSNPRYSFTRTTA